MLTFSRFTTITILVKRVGMLTFAKFTKHEEQLRMMGMVWQRFGYKPKLDKANFLASRC